MLRKLIFKLFIILLCSVALSHQLNAQEDGGYEPRGYRIVPPSPSVSSLFEHKEYAVDNYKGIPQISFPIYTLKSGAITVPIILSYQGGGIRSIQKSGNVGLGWSLSLGAVIAHTVNGAPDDANQPNKMHGLMHLNDTERIFRTELMAKEDEYDPSNYNYYNTHLKHQAEYGLSYSTGLADVANDIFSLAGLGLSGVFAYEDGRQIISSTTPISVKKNTSANIFINDGGADCYGFEVTNQEGIRFIFNTQERTRFDYSYGNPALHQMVDSIYYASAWHLDKIEDLCNNVVNFSYHKSSKKCFGDQRLSYVYAYDMEEPNMSLPRNCNNIKTCAYHPQILDEISANGLSITIAYAHEEFGTRIEPLIKELKILMPDGTIRTIEFKYSLYYGVGTMLEAVVDNGYIILSFEYDGYDYLPFNINSQDFGGYNNGIDNGTDNIPNYVNWGNGANRSVVPDAAQKGILTKITYPTGGFTEFVWESNDFAYLGSATYKGPHLSDNPIVKTEKDEIRMCIDEDYRKLAIENYQMYEHQQLSIDLSRYFLMNPANLYGTDYYHTHKLEAEYPALQPPNYPHIVFFKHANGGLIAEKIIFLDKQTIEDEGENQPINIPLSPGIYDILLVNPLAVSNAYDFLEANMRFGDSPAGYITLIKATYDNIVTQGRNYWCGLRIKRIISHSGNDVDTPIIKQYYYNKYKEPYSTSGTIKLLPEYAHHYYKWYSIQDGLIGYRYCNVNVVGETAFPHTPFGQISQIEYPVITSNLTKDDPYEPDSYLHNFSEKLTFSTARTPAYSDYNKTHFLGLQPIGARMYTSREHYRGNLLTRTISNNTGTNALTKKFSYNIYEKENNPDLSTDAFVICDYANAVGINSYASLDYGIGKYTIIPYNKTIALEETSDDNGLTTFKKYDYFYDKYSDNLDFNLTKSVTIPTSEGAEVTTYFTYKKGPNAFLPFTETEITLRGDELVSARRTTYNNDNLPIASYEINSPISNANILLSNSQSTTSEQVNIINSPTYQYRYNSFGNLVEIRYKSKPLMSYLWGYNGLYPIIEVKNVDYDTLKSAAMNAGMTLSQIEGQTPCLQNIIKDTTTILRRLLPDNEVTTLNYHWLFGIIERTDARGLSSKFEYDANGRLTSVRDFNNHLIQKISYHYANQF